MNVKNGINTSEFWMSLFASIIGLLVTYGIVDDNTGQLWLALFASLSPIIMYTVSRTILKKE